jgi:hypothetical protein
VITQYGGMDDATGTVGLINLTNLAGSSTPDYFDPSTPPTNVTDALVQAEVRKVITAHGSADYSAVYEVFIPSSSYSSDGSATSCGGPNLAYCSYHFYFTDAAGKHVKYSIQPWEGCAGCKAFNNASLDEEHFVCHETREAVMNPSTMPGSTLKATQETTSAHGPRRRSSAPAASATSTNGRISPAAASRHDKSSQPQRHRDHRDHREGFSVSSVPLWLDFLFQCGFRDVFHVFSFSVMSK